MRFCYGSLFFFDIDQGGGIAPPRDDSASTSSRRSGSASRGPASTRRSFPKTILSIPFCVSWPSGAFFLSLWVGGVPLAAFSSSPVVSVAFSSSGWVGSPCRVFPVFSPWFLGGLGGVFGVSVFSFSCYLLHLASLFSKSKLGKPGLPTRNPPGPPPPSSLARLSSPVFCWESSGGRAEVKGGGVTGGVCDPAHYLGTMMVAVRLCVFSPRGTAPPGIDSGRFASARVDSGGLVVFRLQHHNLG